jgi:hypothetical protein
LVGRARGHTGDRAASISSGREGQGSHNCSHTLHLLLVGRMAPQLSTNSPPTSHAHCGSPKFGVGTPLYRPSHITGLKVAVFVNSVERMTRGRALAQIFQEALEPGFVAVSVGPLAANLDAAASVIVIVRSILIFAPLHHIRPGPILGRMLLPQRKRRILWTHLSNARLFISPTSAALRLGLSQIPAVYDPRLAALTDTEPVSPILSTPTICKIEHGPTSKF